MRRIAFLVVATLALAGILNLNADPKPTPVPAGSVEAIVAPPLVALAGGVTVAYRKPQIRLSWTDTITGTVVRTDVMRRDSTDTVWHRIGYTTGKYTNLTDERVVFGRDYHYRVRDSVSGSALSAFSDSIAVRVNRR